MPVPTAIPPASLPLELRSALHAALPHFRSVTAPTVVANLTKNPAQTISRQSTPSGGGLARDSSPLHSRPRPSAPAPSSRRPQRACPELAEEPALSLSKGGSSPRPPSHRNLARTHPASPQEFFRKNSYRARGPRLPGARIRSTVHPIPTTRYPEPAAHLGGYLWRAPHAHDSARLRDPRRQPARRDN